MNRYDSANWLPTSAKEVKARGWDSLDVILFSGDAYVDHPSFGMAVIGRLLESFGLKTAVIPQPKMPAGRYGGTRSRNQSPGFPSRTGAGFHAYTDDRSYGHLLFRSPSLLS